LRGSLYREIDEATELVQAQLVRDGIARILEEHYLPAEELGLEWHRWTTGITDMGALALRADDALRRLS